MNFDEILEKVSDLVTTYGLKLIGAIVALIIGLWVIGIITRSLVKVMKKREVDPSLIPFFRSMINITLKILLFISVIGMIDVKMTSFIAILGAAGLAIGMALSGTLQNFAGGVMLLLFKPFKVDDYIAAAGYEGFVKEIQIFNTILNTPDNRIIIIPNAKISSDSMVNYSKEPQRRVDFSFGIGYGDDVQKAREILVELFAADERILKDPATFIGLGELADSSVNLTVRVWVKGEDYWDVFFSTNEKVYNAFNEKGINIPFPQMDVHVQKD